MLKHRQNTNQRQRIVAFVGSPLNAGTTAESLSELGRKLKKNSIAVDVVDFGSENRENEAIFKAFVEAVDSDACPSRVISVAPYSNLLDAVRSSAPEILGIESSGPSGSGAMDGEGFEFGIDPEMDPELALALKLSMEEEMARQKREGGQNAVGASESVDDVTMTHGQEDDEEAIDDEEMMLQRAIAMSMQQEQPKDPQSKL